MRTNRKNFTIDLREVLQVPLTLANINDELTVKRIGGNNATKRHLENLGFVEGAKIIVISKLSDNFIVNVKDARVAIDGNLAALIYV